MRRMSLFINVQDGLQSGGFVCRANSLCVFKIKFHITEAACDVGIIDAMDIVAAEKLRNKCAPCGKQFDCPFMVAFPVDEIAIQCHAVGDAPEGGQEEETFP